jgi:hypothetical protein
MAKGLRGIGVLMWLAVANTATAHHGIANFDVNREITISGRVAEVRLINPHSWLHIDVTGPDGTVTTWRCELRGASVLRRSGWSADMFARGTEVTVTGAPDRFSPNTCYLGTAVFSDGRRVDRYGQLRASENLRTLPADRPARRSDGRPNLAGDWAGEQRMLTDPRGMSGAFLPMSVATRVEPGSVPEGTQAFPGTRGTDVALAPNPVEAYWNRPSSFPLTEAGQRAIADFDGASTDNPRLRCEPTNILFDWTFESDVNRISQDDHRITLHYGAMGMQRTIHLNAAHPERLTPTRAGHSIGRWDGDVLVVDTIGFEPGILSADARIPHSGELKVTERFELDPEKGALTRSYVAEDRLYLRKAYSGLDTVYLSDVPYAPAPCDDQSYKTGSRSDDNGSPRLVWGTAVAVAAVVLLFAAYRLRRPPRAA